MPALAIPLLGGILVAFAAWMLMYSWDSTFGDWFERLARAMDAVRIPIPRVGGHPLRGLANALRQLASDWRHGLGLMAAATTAPLVALLVAVTKVAWHPVQQTKALAADTGEAIWNLRQTVVPAMIAAKVAWIPKHLIALEREVAALAHRAPIHIVKHITDVAVTKTTVVVHKATSVVLPRVRTVERDAGAIGKKIDSIAKRVAPAALAAAVVATIARSSFRWVRCSRVRNAGQRICGMDSDLLDSLIAGSFLIVGAMSLREFTEAMQESMDTITPQVSKFWRA